jgi:hypothetical protein
VLNITLARVECLSVRGDEEPHWWHARLGHVNMESLWKMEREEPVRGLPAIGQVDELCMSCMASKRAGGLSVHWSWSMGTSVVQSHR